MALAISNSERIGYSAETVWGTTVALNPIKLVRYVSGSFKNDTQSTKSSEIQNSREIADIIRTGIRGGGSFNFELSYGMLDDLLEGLLGGTWTANVLKVGTTRRSFTFERQYTDIGRFHAYKGALLTALSLNVGNGKVIDGSLAFASKAGADAGATAGTGVTAAPTNGVMNPIDSVQLVSVNGVTQTGVTDVQVALAQTNVDYAQLGSIDPADIKPGSFEVTGSYSQYYDDTLSAAQLAAANGWTTVPIAVTLGGAASLKYAILLSKCKLTMAEVSNGGMNQPMMAKYSFSAFVDATTSTMQVTRTP